MSTATARLVPPQAQQGDSGRGQGSVPQTPHLNAVKHGLYAEAVLLPGDDASAFERGRRVCYETYRPQTEDEAECIETMAECRWRLKRCRPMQAAFDGQVLALKADAAGRAAEPDSHQRLHTSMDVTVHQGRIDRLLCRARAKLLELQKLRRLGLIEGAAALPPGCYLDATGEVVQVSAPVGEETTGSTDGQNGKNQERTRTAPLLRAVQAPLPLHRTPMEVDKPARGRLLGGFGRRRVWAQPGVEGAQGRRIGRDGDGRTA